MNKATQTFELCVAGLAVVVLAGCSSSGSSPSGPTSTSSGSSGDATQSSDLIQREGDNGYIYPSLEEAYTGSETVEFALPSARTAIDPGTGEAVAFDLPDDSDTRIFLVGDGEQVILSRDGEEIVFTQDPDDDGIFFGPGESLLEAVAGNIEQSQLIPGDLSYSQFGFWTDGESELSNFYFGFMTQADDMPTGAASYSGGIQGFGIDSSGEFYDVIGSVSIDADFTSNALIGEFTNVGSGDGFEEAFANRGNWNDVSFSADINGNQFSGTTAVTSAGSADNAMGLEASGAVQGNFFGPQAAEAAGIWSLQDGGNMVQGSFGTVKQ
ncbi:transferrin-binding protein-like solute binding protein [Halomonas sp. ANAO-440]|uniref:transferrin-binding protein-like solute binding protein n=1 Tax=Halomonas sp. ANAO-440 TaxID=2861360 RepID=UPI001CAA7EC3|nr:transferrin-binding protein-like solute binding protein [Halomonas sp. ANAO-440]MBZ0331923.1 transferrin-binding protein-like solute binding protein [Halomonas sp. ANAO-440]